MTTRARILQLLLALLVALAPLGAADGGDHANENTSDNSSETTDEPHPEETEGDGDSGHVHDPSNPHAGHVAFDSGHMAPYDWYNATFNVIGNYTYHCHPHPYMKGYVTVDWNATAPEKPLFVEIIDYKFVPQNLTVPPGTVITFINNDSAGHTVTFLEYDGPMGKQRGGRALIPEPGFALAAAGLAGAAIALRRARR